MKSELRKCLTIQKAVSHIAARFPESDFPVTDNCGLSLQFPRTFRFYLQLYNKYTVPYSIVIFHEV